MKEFHNKSIPSILLTTPFETRGTPLIILQKNNKTLGKEY